MRYYKYIGDRHSDPSLVGRYCCAVERGGKCVRGRNGSMLVYFYGYNGGVYMVVAGRRLRIVQLAYAVDQGWHKEMLEELLDSVSPYRRQLKLDL